jgi:hypothetical protein
MQPNIRKMGKYFPGGHFVTNKLDVNVICNFKPLLVTQQTIESTSFISLSTYR